MFRRSTSLATAAVSRLARAAYLSTVFYATIALLGAFQLVWALLASGIRLVVSEQRGRRIGRTFISRLFRSTFRVADWLGLMRVDASALDAIDAREAMIIAPNHPSVVDALILISRLENLNCIMKASVLDNVLLGAGARLAGYIRNDGPKRMLRLSSEDLARGGQLIVFPEGTRTLAAPVNEFKCGFAAMARRARVPIQTVIIETDTAFLSKGWPVLKKPAQLPMHFRVRLGRRFEVGQDVRAFVDELQGYFVDELAGAELGNLWRDPHAAPARGTAPVAHDAPQPAYGTGARSLQR